MHALTPADYDAIRLSKEHFRATMTAILLTLALLRGIGYWAVGEFTGEVMILAAILDRKSVV